MSMPNEKNISHELLFEKRHPAQNCLHKQFILKKLMGPKGLTLVKRGDKFLLHSLSRLTGPQISLPILPRMFSCLHHHKASFFYRSNTLHSPLQCM